MPFCCCNKICCSLSFFSFIFNSSSYSSTSFLYSSKSFICFLYKLLNNWFVFAFLTIKLCLINSLAVALSFSSITRHLFIKFLKSSLKSFFSANNSSKFIIFFPTFSITSTGFKLLFGGSPFISSKQVIPRDQISVPLLYPSFKTTCGDIQYGLPFLLFLKISRSLFNFTPTPKSPILAKPSSDNNIFAPFTSLCIKFLLWIKIKPCNTIFIIVAISISVYVLSIANIKSITLPLAQYSKINHKVFVCLEKYEP